MASKIKVDTLETANGSGTIALSNQLSGMTTASLPTLTSAEMPAGSVVQVVNYQTGAVATGTTQFLHDDSIPQITEGNEFMTLAITPNSTSNKLKIDVVMYCTQNGANYMMSALFQDTTASALAAINVPLAQAANWTNSLSYTHYMTAGTTNATTFKVRGGANGAATFTFNGQTGNRIYGGVAASSITITEIEA